MGYKLKHILELQKDSKTGTSIKSKSVRNHILTKQSTKRKDTIEALINGKTVLKMASKLIKG